MRFIVRTTEQMATIIHGGIADEEKRVLFHEVVDLQTNIVVLGTLDLSWASEKATYLNDKWTREEELLKGENNEK